MSFGSEIMDLTNIYLFTGEETLLIENKIERIIRSSNVDQYNISIYDEDETSISEIVRDAQTPPFMNVAKVIIIKNPKFLTSEKALTNYEEEVFKDYLKQPLDTTIMIVNAGGLKLDDRKDIVKSLKKVAEVKDIKNLTEIEIIGWVKRQCTLSGVNIRDDAIRLFCRLVGKDLLNAKNELEKLINYTGPNGIITTDIVNKVVVKEIQKDVYALSNAIVEQNKEKIISIYNDLIELGNDANYLFSLVSKSIREILIVGLMLQDNYRQADIAKKMRISNGRAYYLVKNARSLDLKTVQDYVMKLGDLDYKIKSGQLELKSGFEFFLFGL
jgi:DNA polymerase-3 subunit delta